MKLPIGLELYSVRHDLDKDLYGTLKAVAEMGYQGVEFAGPPKHTAEVYRAVLDEVGLACCGWHTPFAMVQDDQLAATIKFFKTVGNKRAVVPGVPAKTRQDWLNHVTFFNALADKLGAADLVTGYHNHHVEFTPLEGEQPWDTFFGGTDRRVIMQLDMGNAMRGGADCPAILRKYPGRGGSIHLKPYSAKVAAEKGDPNAGFKPLIGEDDVPWAEVFELCETISATEWYVVEYESDAYPPLEAVKRCLDALRAMGK